MPQPSVGAALGRPETLKTVPGAQAAPLLLPDCLLLWFRACLAPAGEGGN